MPWGRLSIRVLPIIFARLYVKKNLIKIRKPFLIPPLVKGGKEGLTEMAKDPICGMVVPKVRSIKREMGGRAYYFCSETCVRTFEEPEAELKDMRRRVTIASHGVKVSSN